MKWNKCNKENFNPFNNINPRRGTYYLGFSPIDLPEVNEDGDNMKYLQVYHNAPIHLSLVKPLLLDLIKQYDKSDEINVVYINNDKTWFDKDTRVSLVNSLKIQKEIGKINTVIWYTTENELKSVELTIDEALGFLYNLEVYAFKTYNVTQTHIKAIEAIDNLEDLMKYNITTDYPSYIRLTKVIEEQIEEQIEE